MLLQQPSLMIEDQHVREKLGLSLYLAGLWIKKKNPQNLLFWDIHKNELAQEDTSHRASAHSLGKVIWHQYLEFLLRKCVYLIAIGKITSFLLPPAFTFDE
ncbi:hypothetical protein KIL84_015953 [Mauremys mutica]|uniref:Uncharacterized protein n=1 Tax=Mauremys mutica TaxID=74926 RepID=A0A9D3WTM0_9SAUR|nr:hypothetical protein KIL84_015953 [Mauremys mutica]